jgi:hypothetical protein
MINHWRDFGWVRLRRGDVRMGGMSCVGSGINNRYTELVALESCQVPKSGVVIYEHMGERSSFARITCVDRQDGYIYFSGEVNGVSLEEGVNGINAKAFKELDLSKFRKAGALA